MWNPHFPDATPIRACDIIYVMDKGKIVEEGTHEGLIEKRGYYYKLYISQVGSLEEKEMVFQNEFKIEPKNIKEVENILEDGEEYEYRWEDFYKRK